MRCRTDRPLCRVAQASEQVARFRSGGSCASACATARRKDGTSFLAEVTVDSLDEGTALITVRDLWGDEALSAIDEIDDVGAFDRDLVEDSSRWSEEVFRIFGLPPATRPPAIDELRERIIETFRAHGMAVVSQLVINDLAISGCSPRLLGVARGFDLCSGGALPFFGHAFKCLDLFARE